MLNHRPRFEIHNRRSQTFFVFQILNFNQMLERRSRYVNVLNIVLSNVLMETLNT